MVLAKTSVQNLKPYINGKHSSHVFDHGHRALKLDSNEATVTPAPKVMQALTEFIHTSPLNWYPDIHSHRLITKLEEYTGCPPNWIQTFNGSDHALETICRTFLSVGDEVIFCMPTYDHFRVYVEACDATLVPVFGPTPFLPKPELLIKAITPKTKIIYVVNPNNPSGILYSESQIKKILEQSKNTLVILDEAYFEFCNQTMSALIKDYPHLVITRSFSKAFGLAGLRCGYILTQSANLESINKIRIGKNINSLAQVAAEAALDQLDYMEHYVSEVKMAGEWLDKKLKSLGLTVITTPANYLLIQVAQPRALVSFLEEHQVYVRDRSFLPQLDGCVRITIGHQLIMERFWKIFQTIPPAFLFSDHIKKSLHA